MAGGDEEADKMMLLLMELVNGGIGGFDLQKGDLRGICKEDWLENAVGEKREEEGGQRCIDGVSKRNLGHSIIEGHQAKKILWCCGYFGAHRSESSVEFNRGYQRGRTARYPRLAHTGTWQGIQ
ncbi:hypothetical protein GE21DRAFT_1283300 [Neurospora crassa]|nr:hypothetical protein GE21DRAFT_1283300 [Neurospora crassa]